MEINVGMKKEGCACLVLEKNAEIYKKIGVLPNGMMVCGADTNGSSWDWATCVKCGKQWRIFRDDK